MTENADMVPEPAFMSNIMFKPTYGHMTFTPPDGYVYTTVLHVHTCISADDNVSTSCRSSLELRASDSVVTPYEHVKDLLLAEEIRLV
jgi:hypothetical protein